MNSQSMTIWAKNGLKILTNIKILDATAAFSVAVTPETDVIARTPKTVEVEVTPVAK